MPVSVTSIIVLRGSAPAAPGRQDCGGETRGLALMAEALSPVPGSLPGVLFFGAPISSCKGLVLSNPSHT